MSIKKLKNMTLSRVNGGAKSNFNNTFNSSVSAYTTDLVKSGDNEIVIDTAVTKNISSSNSVVKNNKSEIVVGGNPSLQRFINMNNSNKI